MREQRWRRWSSSPPARLLVASQPWIVVMVDEFANWKNSNIVTIAWPVSSEVMGDTSSLGVHVAGPWLHNDYHVHPLSFIATTCQYCRIYMLKLLLGQWIQPDPTSHRDSSSVAALEWTDCQSARYKWSYMDRATTLSLMKMFMQ